MQSATKAALFHVALSKGHNLHYPHYPVGPGTWFKYSQDYANGFTTYKSGPGLSIFIAMKLRPIFEERINEDLLKECFYGVILLQILTLAGKQAFLYLRNLK